MKDYRGVIIEESLENKSILNKVEIINTKVETVTKKHKTPWISQWTLHEVIVKENEVQKIAELISESLDKEHNWYADFRNENYHYIVFRNKVFHINRKSIDEYNKAKEYGLLLGIPIYQVDFHPDIKDWER